MPDRSPPRRSAPCCRRRARATEVALVDDVLASVAARTPIDDREYQSIAEVLATVPRLADPFDMDADPTHITGSALIIGRRGIVLLRHRRLGIWVQPGGHVD